MNMATIPKKFFSEILKPQSIARKKFQYQKFYSIFLEKSQFPKAEPSDFASH